MRHAGWAWHRADASAPGKSGAGAAKGRIGGCSDPKNGNVRAQRPCCAHGLMKSISVLTRSLIRQFLDKAEGA